MKWYGVLGFADSVKTEPGIVEEQITERSYSGDITRMTRRLQSVSDKINDDIGVSNQLSIVADPYAVQNFYKLRYAEFGGTKWKVSDAEVQYPRLILTLGGIWNGNTN